MLVQIIEDESLLSKVNLDAENVEVWLLNKTTESKLDNRIINISELTESSLPNNVKMPRLFTEIAERHFVNGAIPENFDYEVLTKDSTSFMIHAYVCDGSKIKEV